VECVFVIFGILCVLAALSGVSDAFSSGKKKSHGSNYTRPTAKAKRDIAKGRDMQTVRNLALMEDANRKLRDEDL